MTIIACHDCDLLQREGPVPVGGKARCAKCGALLYRSRPDSLDRALALTLTAGVTYLIANLFPIVIISAAGRHLSTTLFGAVVELWNHGMHLVAPLVCLTAIVMPGASILALAYVLLRARGSGAPAHLAVVLRLIQTVKPWAMVEVLLLGILVSIVKLGAYARVTPAPALWAIALLVLLSAAISAVFDPREIWSRIAAVEQVIAAGQPPPGHPWPCAAGGESDRARPPANNPKVSIWSARNPIHEPKR